MKLAGICLISILCLSSCGALQIKTWFLDAHDYNALIRKNKDGTLNEKLEYVQAHGYRCYSPEDDTAWRNRLVACCSQANMLE